MGFNRFILLLVARLSIIFVTLVVLGYLVLMPDLYAMKLLLIAALVAQLLSLFHFISRTNQEVSRFLSAVRYEDFGQRFNLEKLGVGFEELGQTFTELLDRFRVERQGRESDLRYIRSLLEQVPTPLISLHDDGHITLWNNAARRLFGIAQIVSLHDLQQFGDSFKEDIEGLRAGEKKLVTINRDGLQQRLSVSTTEITVDNRKERLVSLVNIQSELDNTQLTAWRDLVRVLTHEIMNSITPIASLAHTASDLVGDARALDGSHAELKESLSDVQDAVDTLARRSDGLMHFVSGYRRLTRLPAPRKSQFTLADLFADVAKISTQHWAGKNLQLHSSIEPSGLDLQADRELVEQVLMNILQNCEQAMAEQPDGCVIMRAKLNFNGHVMIEIMDNGPGIAKTIIDKIFVPFYTTKRDGSGVGLALSRQIMIAHGGVINVGNVKELKIDAIDAFISGACFTLIF